MPVTFRNVDASPADDVHTWPYEALVTVIDRGLVGDWQPIFVELRRSPWGTWLVGWRSISPTGIQMP